MTVGCQACRARLNGGLFKANLKQQFICLVFFLGSMALPAASADVVSIPSKPGQVALFWDDWRVPHVFAVTDEDALFGVGYALAADNLEGILRAFLRVQGNSARAFGIQDGPLDTFNRQWRVEQKARQALHLLDAAERSRLEAYVAGIERFVEDNPDAAPSWMPRLEAHLPIAVTHSLALLISVMQPGQGASDCEASGLPGPFASGANEVGAALAASNQWVVRTGIEGQRGLAVWADSHTDFDDFYAPRSEIRIHGATLQTAGIVAAGTPYPIIASTPHVAWSLTVGGPDTSDCYLIDAPVQAGMVPRASKLRSTDSDTAETATDFPDYVTINDIVVPVLSATDSQAYAIVSAYAERSGALLQQLFAMNTAANIDEFSAAVTGSGFFPQNVMAGDVQGRMYFASTGRVPRRDDTLDWRAPVRMSDPAARWKGYHHHDDLVVHINPDVPYLWNTNTASDTVAPYGNINAREYPTYIFNDVPGRINERWLRFQQLLEQQVMVDEAALLAMGFDQKLFHTARWLAVLKVALKETPPPESAAEFASGILGFDGYTHHSSVVALHYRVWRAAINELLTASGLVSADFETAVVQGRPLPEGSASTMVGALEVARQRMVEKFDRLDVSAGDMIRIGSMEHHWPVGGFSAGGERTLRSMDCRDTLSTGNFCLVDFGQRHPMLTMFGESTQSWSAVPRGQSAGDNIDHNYDQARLLSERRLKPTYLNWKTLRPFIRDSLMLETGLSPQ